MIAPASSVVSFPVDAAFKTLIPLSANVESPVNGRVTGSVVGLRLGIILLRMSPAACTSPSKAASTKACTMLGKAWLTCWRNKPLGVWPLGLPDGFPDFPFSNGIAYQLQNSIGAGFCIIPNGGTRRTVARVGVTPWSASHRGRRPALRDCSRCLVMGNESLFGLRVRYDRAFLAHRAVQSDLRRVFDGTINVMADAFELTPADFPGQFLVKCLR